MFESAMFSDLMQQFCKAAHRNAKDKGFWDEQRITVSPIDAPTNQMEIAQRPINLGEKYMLMVSELCELFEAHRKGKLTASCDKACHIVDPTATTPLQIGCAVCNKTGKVRLYMPESPPSPDINRNTYYDATCTTCNGRGLITTTGIRYLTNEEEEIADICIRIADYCGYRNIDLGAVILSKMNYNATRPHMHGKSC